MDAVIKVPSSQFTIELFDKIKSLIKNEYSLEITISIKERNSDFLLNESEEQYWTRLKKSIKEVEDGKTIVLTMDQLDEFAKTELSA